MKKTILLIITFIICLVGKAFTQEDDSTSLLTFETPGDHMVAIYEKIEQQWLFLIGAPAEGIEIANGMHKYRFGTESFWGKFTVEADGQSQTWRLKPGRPIGVAAGTAIIMGSAFACIMGAPLLNAPLQGSDVLSSLLGLIFINGLGAVLIVGGGVGCLLGVIWVTVSLPSATRVE